MQTQAGDDLAVQRERAALWLPADAVGTIEQACAFVERVGFALLFPAPRLVLPSLWEAVAGEDREPFASGMDEFESLVWDWKDELPRQRLCWYGTYLHKRKSLLSPALLAALYPGAGTPDDHREMELSREAHDLAEALRGGPLTTAALREIVGHRSRYDRAVAELYRSLLVTSGGVRAQRTGWPAGVVDLTCRLFRVGGSFDAGYAAAAFLATLRSASSRDLGGAFGWPVARARAELAALVTAGGAVQTAPDRFTPVRSRINRRRS
jgi:hypothetical protein